MLERRLKTILFSIPGAARLQNTYFPDGSLALRLTRGVSWTITGSVISSASTLLASILVARLLGAEDYGALGIIQSSLGTFMVFAGTSLGLTATKYIAELREKDPKRAGRILVLTTQTSYLLSGIMSLLLLVGAPVIARSALAAPQLAPHLRVAALTLFLSGINGAQIGALAGFEAFGSIARINLLRGLATFPVLWIGTRFFGLLGSVIALGVIAAISCAMSDIVLKRRIRQANFSPSREGAWSEAKLLLNFSLPANLTAVFFVVAIWISNLILVRQPNGYSQMGIFNAVNQWRVAILFLPTVMAQPFLAVLASLAGAGSGRQYRKAIRISLAATTLAAFMPAILVSLFSGSIMSAYGAGFQRGALALVLVSVATALAAPSIAITNVLNSAGRAWSVFGMVMAWSLVFITAFYFLRGYGVHGLGCALLIAYLIQFLIVLLIAARFMKPTAAGAV